ncbi:lipoyl(octanoyl) transferase LipB [Natronoflexus pectinivorans]|uniref:Octanoyltransferase n=1 Tax=Natronoflexus pectinivorans TaxID=682526 RepID=A0A4R2GNC5_9BACT|nr:lipoyl(octanoyl) transferase LipB [Natronoflexus pectinivorans]TCO10785.1 lipoyl(octanoyl) transferase [Natronoflexus pectinivorans]
MQQTTIFHNPGKVDYKQEWDHQENLFDEVVNTKLNNRENTGSKKPVKHHLIFCEHPHVYTLGKSGMPSNLLITDDLLKKIDAVFYKINRGGDITYHGPGQLVGYPIFDLEAMGLGIKEYIFNLEEAIILTLKEIGIPGSRLEGATGVWLDTDKPAQSRKICAIGVRASRHVSMHGFALNINTNLDYFRYINPCGFIDKGVTSIEKELNQHQNFTEISRIVKDKLTDVFQLHFEVS